MRSGAARDPDLAVGSHTHEEWLKHGKLQFDYLLRHGLRPSDRMLEIGCGNLRAGRLFIEYLDPGNYYGLDISPDILLDGQRTLTELGLQAKFAHLALVSDLTFGFLPAAHFSVVHAHSVFSHSPRHVIAECLSNVGRVMAPGAFFDFTFHRTAGAEHHLLGWAFYYRSDTLLGLARSHGLDARIMTDWKRLGGPQSKIRVTAPAAGALTRPTAVASSRARRSCSPLRHHLRTDTRWSRSPGGRGQVRYSLNRPMCPGAGRPVREGM
jgi:SAM-dependent methyltransferase